MLKKISKFFLYASLFSVLVVIYSSFFPFIGGKYYIFRMCVEASIIFFLLWWAFQATRGEVEGLVKQTIRKPLFIAVTAFVAAFTLACLFAHDPHAAFWSNYERGEGGFQMLHYYAFFVLLVLLFREAKDWRRAFGVSLAAAAFMILYGVFSAAFIDLCFGPCIGPYRDPSGAPLGASLWARLATARFQGSLGNPAYVAPYLLFSMFYALYLWLTKKWKWVWSQRIFYGLVILLSLLFFTLSQTRGAFLGLIAAIAAYFIYLIFSTPAWRKKGSIILVALIIVGGVLFSLRNSPAVQKIPGSRFLTISLSDQTAQTRLWTWGSAWKGFLERPIFGWGPENFTTVFDKYFNPNHFVPGANSETWFDRAHSVVFDYLAETGIVGFGTYLAIFIALFWMLFRHGRSRGVSHESPFASTPAYVKALIFAVPVAYLVQGLVLFDVLPIYINVFMFLAFMMYQFYGTQHSPSTS